MNRIYKTYKNTDILNKDKIHNDWFNKSDDVICFWMPTLEKLGFNDNALFSSMFFLASALRENLKIHLFFLSGEENTYSVIYNFIAAKGSFYLCNVKFYFIDEKDLLIFSRKKILKKNLNIQRKNYYLLFYLWLLQNSNYEVTCISHNDMIFGRGIKDEFETFRKNKYDFEARISENFIGEEREKQLSKIWGISQEDFEWHKYPHTQIAFFSRKFLNNFKFFLRIEEKKVKSSSKFFKWPEQEILKIFLNFSKNLKIKNTLLNSGMIYLGLNQNKYKRYSFIHIDSIHYKYFFPWNEHYRTFRSIWDKEVLKESESLWNFFGNY